MKNSQLRNDPFNAVSHTNHTPTAFGQSPFSEPDREHPAIQPRTPRTPHTAPAGLDADTILRESLRTAIEMRAHDVIGLDFGNDSPVADYFVIASGTSVRHAQGIAEKICSTLAQLGEKPQSQSGFENGDWIVLDYGNVVVHVFYEPQRHYFRIEELWKNVPRVQLSGELEREAKKTRTGIIS